MNVRLLLLLSPVIFSAPAEAQDEYSPLSPLFECREIPNDEDRLSCLDAAVDNLRGDTVSGEIVAVNRGQIEAAEEATFGLSIPGLSLPDVPRLSLPSLSGNAEDLIQAEESGVSADRVVTRDDEGNINRIENLAVESIDESPRGRVIVSLQNGQVWRQTDGRHVQLPRRMPDNEMSATIRSGVMGAYFMRLNNLSRWFSVERVD